MANVTSIANDEEFRFIFSRQVEAFGRQGDAALGITTSGTSANVLLGLGRGPGKGNADHRPGRQPAAGAAGHPGGRRWSPWMPTTRRRSRKCISLYCMSWPKRSKKNYLEENMVELSARVKTMTSSPTLKLVQIKKQLQAQGKVILDFGAGEPDFPTPENIKNAGIDAIQKNFTKYTPTSGIAELKKAIRASLSGRSRNLPPRKTRSWSRPGSKYGLFILLQAVIDPGDEVIVPLPYWVSYPEMVKFCGGRVVLCRPPAAGAACSS